MVCNRLSWLAAVAACLGTALCALAHEPYLTGLGFVSGGTLSDPKGVSADGTAVVGYGYPGGGGSEAFRWTAEDGMVGLGHLGTGNVSNAFGCSADGSVVAGYGFNDLDYTNEAFRWTAAEGMVGLGTLSGGNFFSNARGISPDGLTIVGASSSSNGGEAFGWTAAQGMIGLGDLPGGSFDSWAMDASTDGSVIVGGGTWGSNSLDKEAFRWTAAEGMVGLGTLPGADLPRSYAYGVSADGSVVVGWSNSATGREAFRWTTQAGMVGLGYLPGEAKVSEAEDVSGDGSVIVGAAKLNSADEAFVWDAVNGMRTLHDVLVNDFGLDLTGWSLQRANGVSADGRTVVGFGFGPNGAEAWMAHLHRPGDFDGDGDVDLADYAVFADCLSGPDAIPSPTLPGVSAQDCLDAFDFDLDNDVDLPDFAVFSQGFTGSL